MRAVILVAALIVVVPVSLLAHVELRPQVSKPGTEQQYTLRAHNEGKVAVTSLELEIPAELAVTSVAALSTGTYEERREGGRIVAIIWTRDIKPGTFADFRFTARNPASGSQITWHARERLADGTVIEWGGAGAGHKPAPTTRLGEPGKTSPPASDHDNHQPGHDDHRPGGGNQGR